MFKVPAQIREQLRTVPASPGVYYMKDAQGKIIYVGKAKKLKNRLSSYFTGVESHPVKTKNLVVNTKEFEYILTTSEEEALLLEANFIKAHQPKFNVLLKDDKSYPYVLLTKEDFPRLLKVRQLEKRGYCFGPYTGDFDVNHVLDAMHSIHPIRKCHRPMDKVTKPCLYYHMKQCLAPCAFKDVKEAYEKEVNQILTFFRGDKDAFFAQLEERMGEAANRLDFETAITYREQLEAAKRLSLHQQLTQKGDEDIDYLAYAEKENRLCITLFVRRGGKLLDRENHIFDNLLEEDRGETLQEFILQYYQEANFIPRELVVERIHEPDLVKKYLRGLAGHVVEVTIPQRGEKKKTLELVKRNAQEYLNKFSSKIDREQEEKEEIDLALSTLLYSPVHRLEAYDISHLSGTFSVGSMVVYEEGKKKPSDYRRFRLRHVKGPDDVGSMKEMLERRLKRISEEGFGKKPDLLLIDGGVAQVNAVIKTLEELHLSIPVMGMIKDDKHRTQALYLQGEKIPLDKRSALYRFIYQIQEEVHRFALNYHHKLRGKSIEYSILEEIPGVGSKRKQELLKHFQSIDRIKQASLEELCEVPGMNRLVAENIYRFFR